MQSSVSLGAGLKVEENLALDFINTNDWHASQKPVERLETYAGLVAWVERVEGIWNKKRKNPKQTIFERLERPGKALRSNRRP